MSSRNRKPSKSPLRLAWVLALALILALLGAGVALILGSYWPIVAFGIPVAALLVTTGVFVAHGPREPVITVSARYTTTVSWRERFEDTEWRDVLVSAIEMGVAFALLFFLVRVAVLRMVPQFGRRLGDLVLGLLILIVLAGVYFAVSRLGTELLRQNPELQEGVSVLKTWSFGWLLLSAIFIGALVWLYYRGEFVSQLVEIPMPFASWRRAIQDHSVYQPNPWPAGVLGALVVVGTWDWLRTKRSLRRSAAAITTGVVFAIVVSIFGWPAVLPMLGSILLFFLFLAVIRVGPRRLLTALGEFVADLGRWILNAVRLPVRVAGAVYRKATEFLADLFEHFTEYITRFSGLLYSPIEFALKYSLAQFEYIYDRIEIWDPAEPLDEASRQAAIQDADTKRSQSIDEAKDRWRERTSWIR